MWYLYQLTNNSDEEYLNRAYVTLHGAYSAGLQMFMLGYAEKFCDYKVRRDNDKTNVKFFPQPKTSKLAIKR